MTLFECFKQSLGLIKKDIICVVPLIAFSLFSGVVQPLLLGEKEGMTLYMICVYFIHNWMQTVIYGGVVLMACQLLKQGRITLALIHQVLSGFSQLLSFSFVINIPFMILMIFVLDFLSGSSQNVDPSWEVLLVFVIVVGALVPFSAFMYFSLIDFLTRKRSIANCIVNVFLHCFKQYFLCLKWLSVVLWLNILQLMIVPLYLAALPIKHIIISSVNGLLSTVIVLFSVIFYRFVFLDAQSQFPNSS